MKERLEEFARRAGFELAPFESLTSSNDEAADPRYGDGAVVIAERQSRGRGQRGNSWSSAEGMNLTFSTVVLPGSLHAERQFYLSKAVALAVSDAVDSFGVSSRIKWPNDIYIGGRKVAGILIECDLTGPFVSRSILGIGLNVNQREFGPALPNPTSLAVETGRTLDRAEVFERFYLRFQERRGQMERGELDALDADYTGRLYRFGERHPFIDGRTGERFAGTIRGVLPAGELQIEKDGGGIAEYLFKEIEYVIGFSHN